MEIKIPGLVQSVIQLVITYVCGFKNYAFKFIITYFYLIKHELHNLFICSYFTYVHILFLKRDLQYTDCV